MITVLLVDDQRLIRAGFGMILDQTDDIRVVAEAADGHEAIRWAVECAPDVVLMDVDMPRMDGVEATREITARTASKVLILTAFDLDEYAYDGLHHGASGFLLKDVPPELLCDAIRAVADGDAVLTPRITRDLVDRFAAARRRAPDAIAKVDLLTPRELDVLCLVAAGLTNAQIAGRLVLSAATVKTHITRLLAKARAAGPRPGRDLRRRARTALTFTSAGGPARPARRRRW